MVWGGRPNTASHHHDDANSASQLMTQKPEALGECCGQCCGVWVAGRIDVFRILFQIRREYFLFWGIVPYTFLKYFFLMRDINALREQKVWRRNASWSHRVWSRRHEVFLDDQPRGSSTAFFALRAASKAVSWSDGLEICTMKVTPKSWGEMMISNLTGWTGCPVLHGFVSNGLEANKNVEWSHPKLPWIFVWLVMRKQAKRCPFLDIKWRARGGNWGKKRWKERVWDV